MGSVEQVALAFIVGFVFGGVAASMLELVAEKRPSFAAPFFSANHLPRFAVAVLAAGPFMLVNDALAARRSGELTVGALTGILGSASIWLWAIGTVVMSAALLLVEQYWI